MGEAKGNFDIRVRVLKKVIEEEREKSATLEYKIASVEKEAAEQFADNKRTKAYLEEQMRKVNELQQSLASETGQMESRKQEFQNRLAEEERIRIGLEASLNKVTKEKDQLSKDHEAALESLKKLNKDLELYQHE